MQKSSIVRCNGVLPVCLRSHKGEESRLGNLYMLSIEPLLPFLSDASATYLDPWYSLLQRYMHCV